MVYHRHVRTGTALLLAAVLVAAAIGWVMLFREPFPSDRTPEGAYARIVLAIAEDRPRDMFAYLETDAEWASFSIRDARRKASDRVRTSYPEPDRTQLLDAYRAEAEAPDGADVFVLVARRRGWFTRLKRDLSGVKRTEVDGDRATVVTARGSRYPFRKRENGIWGLTIFTAELGSDSERAARDLAVVEAAANDYDREKAK